MVVYMHFNMFQRKTKRYRVRRSGQKCNYRKLYRFDEDKVAWLSDHFLGESNERRGGALKNEDRMRTFLRVVGDPGFQSGVGEDVGIHQTTVSKTCHNFAAKNVGKGNIWLKFPESIEEMESAKAGWRSKYNFPCAIGALDCTQIPIKKPPSHGDEYINRKGFPSLNVQATCKFYETFSSVACGHDCLDLVNPM